jgi:two-component system, NarL family, invasion response regulator UvrY
MKGPEAPALDTPAKRRTLKKSAAAKSVRARQCKRILLVDRQALMRRAVANWVNRFPDLLVCGETANTASALHAVRELNPDLVVTEILRQRDFGFIRELHRRHPRLPILVFSFRDEGWYALDALEAGANGYLMKGVEGTRLVAGIRNVLKGHVVLSRELAARLRPKWPNRRQQAVTTARPPN